MFSRYNITDEMDLELAVKRLGTPAQNEGAEAGSSGANGGG